MSHIRIILTAFFIFRLPLILSSTVILMYFSKNSITVTVDGRQVTFSGKDTIKNDSFCKIRIIDNYCFVIAGNISGTGPITYDAWEILSKIIKISNSELNVKQVITIIGDYLKQVGVYRETHDTIFKTTVDTGQIELLKIGIVGNFNDTIKARSLTFNYTHVDTPKILLDDGFLSLSGSDALFVFYPKMPNNQQDYSITPYRGIESLIEIIKTFASQDTLGIGGSINIYEVKKNSMKFLKNECCPKP